MSYTLGIDLGTIVSAAAVRRDGHSAPCPLGDTSLTVPSVVLPGADGTTRVGEAAARHGGIPAVRLARAADPGEAAPVAGVADAHDAVEHLLRAVVDRAAAAQGGRPARIVLVQPAADAAAGSLAGLVAVAAALAEDGARLVAAPVATAAMLAQEQGLPLGATIAVLDVGGDVTEATLVRRTPERFALVGRPARVAGIAGVDVDAALLHHVDAALDGALSALDPGTEPGSAALHRARLACRRAAEQLLHAEETVVEVGLPRLPARVRMTQAELQRLVELRLDDAVAALERLIGDAGLAPGDLHAAVLIGGSARVPRVAEAVAERLARPVIMDSLPELTAALGATLLGDAPAHPEEPTQPHGTAADAVPAWYRASTAAARPVSGPDTGGGPAADAGEGRWDPAAGPEAVPAHAWRALTGDTTAVAGRAEGTHRVGRAPGGVEPEVDETFWGAEDPDRTAPASAGGDRDADAPPAGAPHQPQRLVAAARRRAAGARGLPAERASRERLGARARRRLAATSVAGVAGAGRRRGGEDRADPRVVAATLALVVLVALAGVLLVMRLGGDGGAPAADAMESGLPGRTPARPDHGEDSDESDDRTRYADRPGAPTPATTSSTAAATSTSAPATSTTGGDASTTTATSDAPGTTDGGDRRAAAVPAPAGTSTTGAAPTTAASTTAPPSSSSSSTAPGPSPTAAPPASGPPAPAPSPAPPSAPAPARPGPPPPTTTTTTRSPGLLGSVLDLLL